MCWSARWAGALRETKSSLGRPHGVTKSVVHGDSSGREPCSLAYSACCICLCGRARVVWVQVLQPSYDICVTLAEAVTHRWCSFLNHTVPTMVRTVFAVCPTYCCRVVCVAAAYPIVVAHPIASSSATRTHCICIGDEVYATSGIACAMLYTVSVALFEST